MEMYLSKLLTIQQQVNELVDEMRSLVPPSKSVEEVSKKRGRPSKKDAEAAKVAVIEAADSGKSAEKPKRTLSDEQKQKMKEGRERAKAARDAEKAAKLISEIESIIDGGSVASTSSKPKIKLARPKTVPAPPSPPSPPSPQGPTEDEPATEENIYKYMFKLQESGKTNMLGSGEYLVKHFKMTKSEAEDIVLNYMTNYESLREKYA